MQAELGHRADFRECPLSGVEPPLLLERKQGCIAYRLLQGIIPALEYLADTTRTELGFEEPQTETEIIEKLKNALAQKAANSSDDLS